MINKNERILITSGEARIANGPHPRYLIASLLWLIQARPLDFIALANEERSVFLSPPFPAFPVRLGGSLRDGDLVKKWPLVLSLSTADARTPLLAVRRGPCFAGCPKSRIFDKLPLPGGGWLGKLLKIPFRRSVTTANSLKASRHDL